MENGLPTTGIVRAKNGGQFQCKKFEGSIQAGTDCETRFADGTLVRGNLRGLKPYGRIEMLPPQGGRITGTMVDDVLQGTARIEYTDGRVFEGEVVASLPTRGTFRYRDGQTTKCSRFEGNDSAGSGCEFRFPNGLVAWGDVKDGKWTGAVEMHTTDGMRVSGIMIGGNWHGAVRMIDRNGNLTNAAYNNGQRIR